jgi:hypothetical protein
LFAGCRHRFRPIGETALARSLWLRDNRGLIFAATIMADSARPYIVTAIAVIIGGMIFLSPKEQGTSRPVGPASTDPNLTDDQRRGLYWDIDHSSWVDPDDRQLFRSAALKVLADEKRCKRIDQGGKSGGGLYKPYSVVCHGEGDDLFNVFFDKADAIGSAPLKNPEPFGESQSRRTCEDAIKDAVSHPSTVDINSIMGYATEAGGNGNRVIWQDFSAKNSYGLELTYRARCLVTPDGKSDLSITGKNESAHSCRMQQLRGAGWVKATALPDTPRVIANLLSKGWIESSDCKDAVLYRLTARITRSLQHICPRD